MKIISFAEANQDFERVLDTVNDDTNVVCIERQNSHDAVIMSLAHLLIIIV